MLIVQAEEYINSAYMSFNSSHIFRMLIYSIFRASPVLRASIMIIILGFRHSLWPRLGLQSKSSLQ